MTGDAIELDLEVTGCAIIRSLFEGVDISLNVLSKRS